MVVGFLVTFGVPNVAIAANLPLLDPNFSIVPEQCRSQCPCGEAAVLQTLQSLMNVAISLAVIAIVFFIVWAGFSFVMSAANAEARAGARKMLTNAIIGMVIVLAAWLIVDFIMKSLYNEETAWGPWNKILEFEGDTCILSQDIKKIEGLPGVVDTIVNVGGQGPGATPGGAGPAPAGGDKCAPIPDSQLEAIDSAGHKLIPSMAERFKSMKAEAAKDGVTLTVVSAYRSPDDQLRAWNNNGCRLVNSRTVCAVRTAAVPCSLGGKGSNHSLGTAVDIRLSGNVYNWLRANAGRYGFYNELSNDLPHWSSSGR